MSVKLVLYGSKHIDLMNFAYDDSGTIRNLQPTSATSSTGVTVTAWMFGGDAADVMHGSNSTDAYYQESLCGMGAGDTIDGHPGDDYLYGDCPSDHGYTVPTGTSSGEADGADTIDGGYGADTIPGYADDDILDGGSSFDVCKDYHGTNSFNQCEYIHPH